MSSMSCVTHAYDRFIPAFIPTGASLVILIDIWSSPIGNWGWGSDVIQTRNSGSISSRSLFASRCSSSLRNLMPRWQFWSSAQHPVDTPWSMNLRATTSWPCPIETERTSFFFFLASCRMASVGSEPMERMQTKGVRSVDSPCVDSKLTGWLSTYRWPITSAMYSLETIMVRSERRARMTSMRCILSRRSSKSGTRCVSGASRSHHCFHCDSPRTMLSGRSLKRGMVCDSWMALSQLVSLIQFPLGFLRTLLMSRAAPPLT
mmetsp:Transcript_36313/g.73274  ORF Transcript_36313/g.73274 Transcript_36313/m.73274 type:complete len:261 (+) Transcript_36313:721-1503(+)